MGCSILLIPSSNPLPILVERTLKPGIPAIVVWPGSTVVEGIVWLEDQSQGQRSSAGCGVGVRVRAVNKAIRPERLLARKNVVK